MRCVFRFLCVCALGVMPLVGCSETSRNICEGVECEDDGNVCTEDVCNPADGTCGVPVGDGTACSDGACLNGSCTTLVNVEGSVVLFEGVEPEPPAVGATVSVHGTSLSATTNESGEFSFDVFAGDWLFQTSKRDTWGFIQLETVPSMGRSDLELAIAADALAEELAKDLGITIDEAKGLVMLSFDFSSGQGGETATLSEPHTHASATNADGDEVLTEALLEGGGYELTFYNVGLTDELIVTPRGAQGVNTCDLDDPGTVYPVVAKFVTDVDVVCTSP